MYANTNISILISQLSSHLNLMSKSHLTKKLSPEHKNSLILIWMKIIFQQIKGISHG